MRCDTTSVTFETLLVLCVPSFVDKIIQIIKSLSIPSLIVLMLGNTLGSTGSGTPSTGGASSLIGLSSTNPNSPVESFSGSSSRAAEELSALKKYLFSTCRHSMN